MMDLPSYLEVLKNSFEETEEKISNIFLQFPYRYLPTYTQIGVGVVT